MQFLHIYDDSKRPAGVKLADAASAYEKRFGQRPTLILVCEGEGAPLPGCEVRPEKRIGPNNFHVGRVE